MRVLLVGIGESYHVGAFFCKALAALGHEYVFVDESAYPQPLAHFRFHNLAYRLLGKRPLTYWKFNSDILKCAQEFKPETVLVTGGCHVSPQTLAEIRANTGAVLVNYATDDPFNPSHSSSHLLGGIRLYDLYACTKRAIIADVRRAGCPNVYFVPFAYEPSLHFPESPSSEEDCSRFDSDVAFVGGGDPDRFPYFRALAEAIPSLRLDLYGGYWGRDRCLRCYDRGMATGRRFRLALGGTRVAPGLVRRVNRDGHSMRSFEIPACAAFGIFERTDEHLEMFDDGKYAAFFSSAEELVDKVKYFLRHDGDRRRMAEAAHRRITEGANTYRDRLEQILKLAEPLRAG